MSLIEHIISLYAPHTCVGCGAEIDSLLCDNCVASLPVVPSRCYKCKAVTREYATCSHCQSLTSLSHVYVAVHYEGVVRDLLRAVKYGRAKSGARDIARRIAPLLRAVPPSVVLVPVPTATSRVRQRGYDQAVLIALETAQRTGLHHERLLARLGQAHQVGAGRAERLRHLEGAFRLVHADDVVGTHVLLVDDVLTTGATLETAAGILKKAGAKQVDAVVFAQA